MQCTQKGTTPIHCNWEWYFPVIIIYTCLVCPIIEVWQYVPPITVLDPGGARAVNVSILHFESMHSANNHVRQMT